MISDEQIMIDPAVRPLYYILKDHTPIPCDLMTWAEWCEKSDRIVAQEHIYGSWVSTVFLGLDHSWGDGPPILFETMVFNGLLDQEMERCSTWDVAVIMHAAMCRKVRKAYRTEYLKIISMAAIISIIILHFI